MAKLNVSHEIILNPSVSSKLKSQSNEVLVQSERPTMSSSMPELDSSITITSLSQLNLQQNTYSKILRGAQMLTSQNKVPGILKRKVNSKKPTHKETVFETFKRNFKGMFSEKHQPASDLANVTYPIRQKAYLFLNQPRTLVSIMYHLVVLIFLITYSVIILSQNKSLWQQTCSRVDFNKNLTNIPHFVQKVIEFIMVGHNAIIFVVRVWCSRCLPYYGKRSTFTWLRLYLSKFSHFIDLVAAVASLVLTPCLMTTYNDVVWIVNIFILLQSFHRLFNVLQWISCEVKESPWTLMVQVFQEQGLILFHLFYFEVSLIFVLAYSVFVVENYFVEQPGLGKSIADLGEGNVTISNMLDALYYSAVTLSTIGFGDMTPVSVHKCGNFPNYPFFSTGILH